MPHPYSAEKIIPKRINKECAMMTESTEFNLETGS